MAENINSNTFAELGVSGLKYANGTVQEEFLPQLAGNKAIKVYREMMDNSPVVGAILFAVEMLCRSVSWSVTPASESTQDKEAADFLDGVMSDMSSSWEDTISEILSMLPFGWSYHEIVYKRRMGDSEDPTQRSRFKDGRIGWRKLPIRAQETLAQWVLDDTGGVKGLIQQPPPKYDFRFIPIEKALLFRTKNEKGNPQGRSVLRNAYRPWYFGKKIEELEGIGIERDLAGLPIAYVPPQILSANATPDERAVLEAIKRIVTNVRRDEQEGVVFPVVYDDQGHKLYEFSLLSTGGRRQFDTNAIIQRLDGRIAMTILADVILLGHEAVGSYALSSSKTDLFATAITSWLDGIAAVFNRHAVPRLFKLNGFKAEKLPEITHSALKMPSLKDLGAFIRDVSGAGIDLSNDIELENHLRNLANLPQREREQSAVND